MRTLQTSLGDWCGCARACGRVSIAIETLQDAGEQEEPEDPSFHPEIFLLIMPYSSTVPNFKVQISKLSLDGAFEESG